MLGISRAINYLFIGKLDLVRRYQGYRDSVFR